MTHPDPDSVVKLQTLIRSLVGQGRLPQQIAALLDGDVVAPWPEYAVALFDLDLSVGVKKLLRQAWQAAARHGIARREIRPLAPTSTGELHAATEAAYVELMRLIQVRSGRTPSQLAAAAGPGLPRSQAYSMLRRETLPTKPEQVRLFLTTCGLPEDQVERMLQLWSELRERSAASRYGARGTGSAAPDVVAQYAGLLQRANPETEEPSRGLSRSKSTSIRW